MAESKQSQDEIIKYAKKIGIVSHILTGRLQYDRLGDYRKYDDLIPSFRIAAN